METRKSNDLFETGLEESRSNTNMYIEAVSIGNRDELLRNI